jgi:hypothetical protein
LKKNIVNGWIITGTVLILIGWCPLGAIILLAEMGVWPNPNPNPIGPGLLFFFTFLPAVVCLIIGAIQAWRNRR